MRSWLSSPVVALISFVASVIGVAQWVVSLARGVYRMTQADEARRRACVWFAVASLAVVVVISLLSWSAIMVAAAKIGDGGVLGALYPVTVNGTAAIGALMLLLDALDGRRFSLLPCCMLVMGLVFAAFEYMAYGGAPGWGRYAVAVAPGVVTAMLPLVMLGRAHGTRPPVGSARRAA